jgi:hypothetical protein
MEVRGSLNVPGWYFRGELRRSGCSLRRGYLYNLAQVEGRRHASLQTLRSGPTGPHWGRSDLGKNPLGQKCPSQGNELRTKNRKLDIIPALPSDRLQMSQDHAISYPIPLQSVYQMTLLIHPSFSTIDSLPFHSSASLLGNGRRKFRVLRRNGFSADGKFSVSDRPVFTTVRPACRSFTVLHPVDP